MSKERGISYLATQSKWSQVNWKTNSRVFIILGGTGASPFPIVLSAPVPVTALRKPENGSPFYHHMHCPLLSHTHLLFLSCFWSARPLSSVITDFFFPILEKGAEKHCLAKKKKKKGNLGERKIYIHVKDSK